MSDRRIPEPAACAEHRILRDPSFLFSVFNRIRRSFLARFEGEILKSLESVLRKISANFSGAGLVLLEKGHKNFCALRFSQTHATVQRGAMAPIIVAAGVLGTVPPMHPQLYS